MREGRNSDVSPSPTTFNSSTVIHNNAGPAADFPRRPTDHTQPQLAYPLIQGDASSEADEAGQAVHVRCLPSRLLAVFSKSTPDQHR
jgi:hypothetical protein